MSLNFDSKKERNQVFETGRAIMEIIDYERWDTDDSKPVVSLKMKCLKGKSKGMVSKIAYFIVDGAKWKFSQLMDAIGKGDEHVDLDNINAMKKMFVGGRFLTVVNHNDFNGKTYANLDDTVALNKEQEDSVSDQTRAQPDFSENNDPESGNSTAPNAPGSDDDDIPF